MVDDNRYRLRRIAKAMTQEHLAKASGIGTRTIGRLEKGFDVSAENLRAVCAVLELDVEGHVRSEAIPDAGRATVIAEPEAAPVRALREDGNAADDLSDMVWIVAFVLATWFALTSFGPLHGSGRILFETARPWLAEVARSLFVPLAACAIVSSIVHVQGWRRPSVAVVSMIVGGVGTASLAGYHLAARGLSPRAVSALMEADMTVAFTTWFELAGLLVAGIAVAADGISRCPPLLQAFLRDGTSGS